MTEHANPDTQHRESPWQWALSIAIGAALGAGVYAMAEVRHTKQQAEHWAQALPPTAATEAPKVEPAKAEPTEIAKPAEADAKDSAAKPAEPEDPKARALAARTAAEQALLDEARTQLESKNAAGAQATLDRMKKRFAHGSLVQERELLRIEVQVARGQAAAAKRAARKFAKAYPDNEHLSQLDSLIAN